MAGLEQEEEGAGGTEVELEQRVKEFKDEGLQPKEIAVRILKETPNVDLDELSEILSMDKMDLGRIKGPIIRRARAAAAAAAAAVGGKGRLPAEGPPSPYKGDVETISILDEVLVGHPDVPDRARDEVLSWAKLKGGLHPMELPYILGSMRGISSTTANIVATKYSLALQKAQSEGKLSPAQMPMFTGTGPGPTQPSMMGGGLMFTPSQQWGQQWGQQQWGQQPGQPPFYQPYITREELLRMEEERRRTSEIQSLKTEMENRFRKIDTDLGTVLREFREDVKSDLQGLKESTTQYEETETPIDAEGKPCAPEKAVSVRRVRRPVGAGGGEDAVTQLTRLRAAGIIPEPSKFTLEDVRKVVREEKPSTGESSDVKELKDELKRAQEKIEDLKESMSSKEREDLRGEIRALRERVESAPRAGESDFQSTLRETGSIIREKKPLSEVKEILLGQPGEKTVESGAREGLASRLPSRLVSER